MPMIQRIDMPQLVRVRKYEVDCEALNMLLRKHKAMTGKSNKALSEALNLPITKVEHWFRTDSCFAIPSEDVWFALKEQLWITTTEFDEAITTFEERPGVYEKSERCYFADGIAPTLTSASAGNEKIIVEVKTMQDFPTVGTIIDDTQGFDGTRCYKNGISPTLRASRQGLKTMAPDLRIRKLTPKECFRLMGFDDADYEKAAQVNSNTQLYKQAGNSIGVPVVQHIMKALFDCGALTI